PGDVAVLALAEQLERGAQEAQRDAVGRVAQRALRVLLEQLEVAAVRRLGLRLQPRAGRLVELELAGLDDRGGARQLAHLAKLGVGEGGLGRAAPAEQA